jgi:hypothetical protein
MHRILRTMAAGTCALLGACATMANPSRISKNDPLTGPTGVTTARVPLRNWSPDVRVFADGRLLQIYDADPVLSARITLSCLEAQAAIERTGSASGSLSSCAFMSPTLVLPKRAHTLRFVRGSGESATVTVKPSLHPAWFMANWVWMMFAPVGWAVDLAGGRWTYFDVDGVDVAAVFRDASRQAAGGRQ